MIRITEQQKSIGPPRHVPLRLVPFVVFASALAGCVSAAECQIGADRGAMREEKEPAGDLGRDAHHSESGEPA